MTQNFYALCRKQNGVQVKRIRLNNTVRAELVQLFNTQEDVYLHGIDTEEEYTADWEREPNEIFIINNHPEIDAIAQVVAGNAQAIPNLNVGNFDNENIKAVFTCVTIGGHSKFLFQSFSARQMLYRKMVLEFDQNHFNRLTNTAFVVDDKLGCIVEDGVLKFKSYPVARAIFDLTSYYLEATDEDIDSFFDAASAFAVEDLDEFKSNTADQVIRKLIHSILTKRNIDQYSDTQITDAAESVELALQQDTNGKIVLPQNRKEAKNILRFLDDKLYEAPLSRERYITNSSKPLD